MAERGADRHRQRPLNQSRPALGPPDPVSVRTADNVKLSGLRYGGREAETAVVFAHGFTGTQYNRRVVALARQLAQGGMAVYTADFRGHGASGGLSTLGDLEVNDLDAMVAAARRDQQRVVSVGASMGGFVALRHAGLGGDVDAVVSISSPAVGREPSLPRARLLGRTVRSARGRRLLERLGTRVAPVAATDIAPPLDLASRIAPVPVAIVHGGRDRYVPLADAHALYDRLGEPKRLIVLPRFGHGEAGFTSDFAVRLGRLIADLLAPR
jgi:alpha-beta hydrolase superfamily lysophospholipase